MYNGIINIYKEQGFTSHDVVAKLRGILKQKKIGHTGTLDPDAVGVLPVCIGSATKLCDMLTDRDKEYEAVMRLGVVTDTQDMSGRIIKESPVMVTEEEAAGAILSFVGEYAQIPPMYSALKINGKKLYELARQGKEVERAPRPVTIYDIEILNSRLPEITFRTACSKGTYIRTLCHDIGEKLSCGASMKTLKRTKAGRFTLDTAITLAELEKLCGEGRVEEALIPVEDMFEGLASLHVAAAYTGLIQNGNRFYLKHILEKRRFADREEVRVYDHTGRFYGIFMYEEEKQGFKPKKMFLGE